MSEQQLKISNENGQREGICYLPMSDGEWMMVSVLASRRESGGVNTIDPIQFDPGARGVKRVAREVLENARLTEHGGYDGWQLSVEMEPAPERDDRSWSLALVLADRLARGVVAPQSTGRLLALGDSTAWELGRVEPLADGDQAVRLNQLNRAMEEGDQLLLADHSGALTVAEMDRLADGDVRQISHLGALLGHPDPASRSRQARVWFPLISGLAQQDQLASVEVTVLPSVEGEQSGGEVQFVGLHDPQLKQRIAEEVLQPARIAEGGSSTQWLTSIRFQPATFSDNSFELALVLADRIARGRELPAPGRLIATGCSSRWSTGEVAAVGEMAAKMALFEREVLSGDRLLVPPTDSDGNATREQFFDSFGQIQQQGASVAVVQKI